MVDGIQAMTVYKNVSDEAAAALEVSKAILEGKSLDDKLAGSLHAEASFDTTTYNNGAMTVPSYLLVPVSITANDLDLLVETGLYKWDAAHTYLEAVK
jgi:putative multiple sugar transport system substrate-binding protein